MAPDVPRLVECEPRRLEIPHHVGEVVRGGHGRRRGTGARQSHHAAHLKLERRDLAPLALVRHRHAKVRDAIDFRQRRGEDALAQQFVAGIHARGDTHELAEVRQRDPGGFACIPFPAQIVCAQFPQGQGILTRKLLLQVEIEARKHVGIIELGPQMRGKAIGAHAMFNLDRGQQDGGSPAMGAILA